MKKTEATTLLGGTPSAAAAAIGISYQAYRQWPEDLPRRLLDRVQAALARKHLPAELLGAASPPQCDDASDALAMQPNLDER